MDEVEKAIRGIQEGEDGNEHFEVIFHAYYRAISDFFQRRGYDDELSRDLVQVVFMRSFASLKEYRREGFNNWILAIARHTHLNQMRDQHALKRRAVEVSMSSFAEDTMPASTPVFSDPPEDPLKALLQNEGSELVWNAVEALPSRMREMVRMRYAGGETLRSIAEATEVPVSTVKSLLHQARRKAAALVESAETSLVLGVPLDPAQDTDGDAKETTLISGLIQTCSFELVKWLVAHPEDLYEVHPGTFERIVAEIFESEGFEVEVVSSWNQEDGGVDLLAVKRCSALEDIRMAIQCKRHAASNRVSAEPVRALSGILDRFRAHAGVVATTSHFTVPALQETKKYHWRISLRDHDNIVRSLRDLGGYSLTESGLWMPNESVVEV